MKGCDLDGGLTWWLMHPGPQAVTGVEAGETLQTLSFAHQRHGAPRSAPMPVQYRTAFVRENRRWLLAHVLSLAARESVTCRGTTPCRASHSPLASALALDDAARAETLSGVAFTGFARPRRSPVVG